MRIDDLKNIMGVDAEDIIEESVNLLIEREWEDITHYGVKANLETSLYNKDEKLMRFKDNPYYNGNLQLVMPIKVIRNVSFHDAKYCIADMMNKLDDEPRDTTPDGKYPIDFVKEGSAKKWITVDDVMSDETNKITKTIFEKFDRNCRSYESMTLFSRMEMALDCIKCNISERLSEYVANRLNEIFDLTKKKFIAGQKTSKAVNRILNMSRNYLQYYNDLFTRFGNSINPYETDAYFVVSINFLDYLRMSDGVSWSSCHTTDYHNTRQMPHSYQGAFVQGALSYANDNTSIVAYVIEAKGADTKHPDRTPKIHRCMFHAFDDFSQFIQGRVYPNGREDNSCTDIYNFYYDNFMKIMGLNKDEYTCIGRSDENASVTTCGANYRDYYEYPDPRLFVANGKQNKKMYIGYAAYSCADGEELDIDEHDTIV